jgi:hypothetical protein
MTVIRTIPFNSLHQEFDMRNTMIVMSALALTVAAPAAAQNTDNTVNATTAEPAANADAAVSDNMSVTTDPAMAGTNDLTAAPAAIDQPVETTDAPAAPAPKRGFPWGVVGLLGLAGLMGRKSR